MTTPEQNKTAIQQGQKGGPDQKNQNAQGALGAEQDRKSKSGVTPESQGGAQPDDKQQQS